VVGLAAAVGLISYYLFRPNSAQRGQQQNPLHSKQQAVSTQPPGLQQTAVPVTPVPVPVQEQQQEEAKKAAEELKQNKAEELRKQEELKAAQEEKKKAEELAKLQEEKSAEQEKVPQEAKVEQPAETEPTPVPQVEEAALTPPLKEQIQPAQETPVESKAAEPEAAPQQTPEVTSTVPPPVESVVNEGDLVELSPSVVKPVITTRVDPEYPRIAMGKKLEGTVILSVLVSEKGEPQEVKVLRGASRSEAFNEAALHAVKQWKFQPAVKAGKRVKVWITYPIVFKLQ
jgi:periplasmic protein TonB